MSFWNFLIMHHDEILSRTLEHLLLVGAAMLAAVVIGIPLGIALVRRQILRRWVLGAANVIQTIPSLALFGFLIPVPFLGGIGATTAIVALALYALLPILHRSIGKSSLTISGRPVGVRAASLAIDSSGRTIWIADAHRGDGRHKTMHLFQLASCKAIPDMKIRRHLTRHTLGRLPRFC